MNNRLTPKERGLLKGALRRIFVRSDLRRQVIEESIVEHYDPTRKRVKTWCRCTICGKLDAKSNVQVDHIEPVVPLDSTLEKMDVDELINRQWCNIDNLQVICISCHNIKSSVERKQRLAYKKANKKESST